MRLITGRFAGALTISGGSINLLSGRCSGLAVTSRTGLTVAASFTSSVVRLITGRFAGPFTPSGGRTISRSGRCLALAGSVREGLSVAATLARSAVRFLPVTLAGPLTISGPFSPTMPNWPRGMVPPLSYMPAKPIVGNPPGGSTTLPSVFTVAGCCRVTCSGSFALAASLLTMPSFSSSQDTPDLSESSGCMTMFNPDASASPNCRPIDAALCSSAEVDLTGVSRSVNQPHNAWTLSPIHWKTGCSGSNAELIGAAAALNPSTTPPKNALIGCQYFQTTSATPASAATTSPIGLSRAPSNPEIPYSATRRRASGPDARKRSTPPAADNPPRNAASGFITMPIMLRIPDIPPRRTASGAPASAFSALPASPAERRRELRGDVSNPALLPDAARPRRNRESGAFASQDSAPPVRVTADITDGSVFIPSTDRPKRITASGPSTAATATASVPSTTVIAAVAAATFISVPASCGLASTHRRSAPVTLLTYPIISISGWRRVSPRLLKAFCAPVLTSNHCAESESLLISDSFCMEPLASVPEVSFSCRCSSGRLFASFAASSPNSLPNIIVMADRRLSCGSLLTFSSTR